MSGRHEERPRGPRKPTAKKPGAKQFDFEPVWGGIFNLFRELGIERERIPLIPACQGLPAALRAGPQLSGGVRIA